MKKLLKNILDNKGKTVPILSFTSSSLLGIDILSLVSSSEMQAAGMEAIAKRCNVGAIVNMMDLSVEAEAFGCEIRFSKSEVPTVTKGALSDISDVYTLTVPDADAKRCPVFIEGIKKAKEKIGSTPVFCGVIGPYSLAGRLFDMTELMMACYDEPDKVHLLLKKSTEFIKKYLASLKDAGADGVIMAEPAAGLLSPDLFEEFSTLYVKEIFDSVQDEDFIICYHNCGNSVIASAQSIATLGADIYHFGNAIKLSDIIPLMPSDAAVMGNIDPLLLKDGSVEEIKKSIEVLYVECSAFDNFMISSGCDIPASTKWENLDAYFEKVSELYG